jgi:ABC-type transport system involved in multi-copper enzyme maturation permease subunit
MIAFFTGAGVIFSLEMRQRVRGVAWYVLLGVFVGLVGLVTLLMTIALDGFGNTTGGGQIFSTIIYFVLLLGTLVTPALSGNAINGDRDAGTLATTQVTLITTWQLLIGKFLAAWVMALAFLVASVPFLVFSGFTGGVHPDAVVVSVLVLAVELGVVAAIGVGLSAIITKPLFSIVISYLAVALLSIGTLIAFTLGGLVVQQPQTSTNYQASSYLDSGEPVNCTISDATTDPVPRFDLFWGVLMANPYVLLADAVPTHYDSSGYPDDLFGSLKVGERQAQIPPQASVVWNECADWQKFGDNGNPGPSAKHVIDSTVPGWFVGLVLHLVLAVGALVWAWARLRTPAGRLAKGSRIA